jgi:mono/diheme cytochrome c family protein
VLLFAAIFRNRGASAEGEKRLMMIKWLQRIALFSFVLALALPPLAAAQSAADTYKAKCAGCHGADGSKSMMGAKPLNGAEVQGMSDADLTAAITDGKGKMPAYKGKLSDAQIKDLVAYIRTLKK